MEDQQKREVKQSNVDQSEGLGLAGCDIMLLMTFILTLLEKVNQRKQLSGEL